MESRGHPPHEQLIGYRFGEVELDLLRGCVRVAGADVGAAPLPMRLLALLCERPGELLSRDALFEGVWPRQQVSDDALNKLISRLRELLGPEAEALVTVRRLGLRLDAAVLPVWRSGPATAPTGAAASATDPDLLAVEPAAPVAAAPVGATVSATLVGATPAAADVGATPVIAAEAPGRAPPMPQTPPRTIPPGRMALLAALLVLGLGLLGVGLQRSLRPAAAVVAADEPVFASFAVRRADVRAASPETAGLLRAVEAALDHGDAGQARHLLRSLEASDTQSPLLPALRVVLAGSDDPVPAAELIARARARLGAADSPYARLLVDFAAASRGSDVAERAALDALLTLRPQAWRLRLRRVHLDLQQAQFDSARRQLQAFALDGVPAATRMFVLADRASLGEAAVVEALLRDGALAASPLEQRYVAARIRLSRRQPCSADFAALATDAERTPAPQLRLLALELAAACAWLADEPQADARLHGAAHALREGGRAAQAGPLLGLAAEVASRQQRGAEAREWLHQAAAQPVTLAGRVELEIVNAQLGLFPAGELLDTRGASDARFGRGEPALLAGWQAWRRGDPAAARAALAAARAAGIEQSTHREAARLLAHRLGEPAAPCWVDPPYPDLLRLVSCRALDRHAAQSTARTRTTP